MDECEVCGRNSNDLYLVDIEGAQMTVCASCAKGKDILQEFSDRKKPEPVSVKRAPRTELQVVDNFGEVIRRARESLGLPTRVLAERINEKDSTLMRVEKGEMLPDDKLAKKLEKELDIKLMVQESQEKKQYSASKQDRVTLGDSAVIKDKRDKGN
jgi:putative transcription factor